MRKLIITYISLLLTIISYGQASPIKTYYVEFIDFPKSMQEDIESKLINKTAMLNENHTIQIVDNNELPDTKNELHKFELFSNNNKNGIIKIRVRYSQKKLSSPETYRGTHSQYYSVEQFILEKSKWRRILNTR